MQFEDTATYVNLARSFAGESQAGMRYQLAARMATQQGYMTLADTIRSIAKNETVHRADFLRNSTNAENSRTTSNSTPAIRFTAEV